MKKKFVHDSGGITMSFWEKNVLKMKLTLLFLSLTFAQLIANDSYSQTRLSMDMKNTTVENVLNEIESQSGYYFIFNRNIVDVNRKVNVSYEDQNVEQALTNLFEGTDVSVDIKDTHIILKSNSVNLQLQKSITGNITDDTGESLPGVTVALKGTTIGTITDFDGNYNLAEIPDDAIIVISFVGMRTQEISVANKDVINITMQQETIGLDEVVAVGYGVQKKSVITGAISSVRSEDIANTSITRAEQALQANTAGVQVLSGSGSPGAGMKVRIRGFSSNGKSEPLYIVDGLRTNDISTIDPNNISNMEVLKDAASAAIYGAEGGNGVVIITTKTGVSGESQVSYDFQYGIQELGHKAEMMNAAQYTGYMTESGAISSVTSSINTDWVDETFESSPMVKHYLSFTGGNDKGKYLASMSYVNQEGIVKGPQDNYKRYTGMFNADYKLNSWLKLGSNMTLNHSVRKSVSESSEYFGLIGNALMLDPLTPVEYTGELPANVQTLLDLGKKLLKSPDGNYWGISQYVNGENINPFVNRDATSSTATTDGLMGSFFAEISPVEGLTVTTKFGLDVNYNNRKTYEQEYFYNTDMYNDYASVSDAISYRTYWQWENYATYVKSIDKHNFTALAGVSSSESKVKSLSASGYPLIKDDVSFAELDFITSDTNDAVGGTTIFDRKFSYFGRVSYDYDNKYLFQANIRRDAVGLSILPKDTRWGTFPSFSAGWVMSNEDFFPKTFLSSVKIRASWGENGSISNLGGYRYASTISSSYLYPLSDGSYAIGSKPAQLSNNELKWETSVQTDIGIDLRAFDDKLTLTVDYYNKKTTDLITSNTPPLEAGNTASPVNGGDVQNKGFEFELGYRGSINDFNYSINANVATLKNEVTYLNPTLTRINGAQVNSEIMTAFEENQPIWYFYGYKTSGIDKTTGDAIFVDTNNDTFINANDKTYIGDPIPDLTYGGTINLEYKGLDLNIVGVGTYGNDVLMGMVRVDRPSSNRFSLFYTDRWTPENTTATRPSANVNSTYWNSDGMIFSGSFFRIKQIQLGYSLSPKLLNKVKFNKVRLYVSLEDYFTFTKYPGMDPEATSASRTGTDGSDAQISSNSSQGIDRGYFPASKKVMFGASIVF